MPHLTDRHTKFARIDELYQWGYSKVSRVENAAVYAIICSGATALLNFTSKYHHIHWDKHLFVGGDPAPPGAALALLAHRCQSAKARYSTSLQHADVRLCVYNAMVAAGAQVRAFFAQLHRMFLKSNIPADAGKKPTEERSPDQKSAQSREDADDLLLVDLDGEEDVVEVPA